VAAVQSSTVEMRPVASRRDLIRFLELPAVLYRDDSAWVPPLLFERLNHLDPRRNPFFAHADVQFWIAERGGQAVGRISAQMNRPGQGRDGHGREGHFGFLEAEDSKETFAALLGTAEAWLRARGAVRSLGPFSLSINDESGLLIDGFETPPFVMMGHARRYYATRVEQQGYAKAKDMVAYLYDLTVEPAPSVQAFMSKVRSLRAVAFRSMDPRRFDQEIAEVVRIFNDAWAGNWGFVAMSNDDLRYLAQNIRQLLRPGDVAFGELDGATVAMAVCLPNLNEAITDFSGRLLPANWLKLLWRLKVAGLKTARVPLMGVARRHQGTALGVALMLGVIERVREWHRAHGTRIAELSWVLEENRPMRRMIELIGGRPYKTYRIYQKDLA
jgi:GNAT superfamily N-acetyltransferase